MNHNAGGQNVNWAVVLKYGKVIKGAVNCFQMHDRFILFTAEKMWHGYYHGNFTMCHCGPLCLEDKAKSKPSYSCILGWMNFENRKIYTWGLLSVFQDIVKWGFQYKKGNCSLHSWTGPFDGAVGIKGHCVSILEANLHDTALGIARTWSRAVQYYWRRCDWIQFRHGSKESIGLSW